MIDVIDNKYFYLHNKEVAYLFDLLPNQQLEHLYYGEDLGNYLRTIWNICRFIQIKLLEQ